MKRNNRRRLVAGIGFMVAFGLWTAALRLVDVQDVGPWGAAVGLASVNLFVHNLTGVHMPLYVITDWLGLVPLAVAAGFALLGLAQWVKRKRLRAVDRSILALGGLYAAVIAAYALFEVMVVNARPVLIEGRLEASYPSSTTMLVLCVMPTAMMQMRLRIRSRPLRQWTMAAALAFIAFMVIGRLVSGVHWFTDIIGGALLSAGLVLLYTAIGWPESE